MIRKINKEVERQCREKMQQCSDENIAWILHSLYMNYPVDGPYISLTSREYGSEFVCLDHKRRGLFKTHIFGAYGIGGIVYSIQGSPPRGIVIVTPEIIIFENLYSSLKSPTIISRFYNKINFKQEVGNYFLECLKKEIKAFDRKDIPLPSYRFKNEP